MPDVACTLFLGDCLPKFQNTLYQLIFSVWLYLPSKIFFKLVPQILDRVHVWAFRWSPPPIDSLLLKELGDPAGGMLWVIIMHEAMPIRAHFMQEWEESLSQNSYVEVNVHDALEHENPGPPMHTNLSPDMGLDRVFGPV